MKDETEWWLFILRGFSTTVLMTAIIISSCRVSKVEKGVEELQAKQRTTKTGE